MLPTYVFNGLMEGGIYVLVALGLTMVYGILDIMNFAHGEFLVLGAYTTYYVAKWLGANLVVVGLVASVIVAGAVGLVLERAVFRPTLERPLNALIVSLGLIAVFQQVGVLLFSDDPISVQPTLKGSIDVLGVRIADQKLLVFGVTVLLVLGLLLFLRRSKWGTAIRATGQDKTAARLMGVDVTRVSQLTFAVGAALAAAAGALFVTLFTVTPFSGDIVSKAFAVIILGGLGSVPGAVIGGLVLGVAENLGVAYVSTALQDATGFIVVLLVLVFRPEGIVAYARRVG